jgi:NADH-quinone oxidoreductase subunit A
VRRLFYNVAYTTIEEVGGGRMNDALQNPEMFGLLAFAVLSVGMGVVVVVLVRVVTWLLGTREFKRGKYEPYECGVPLIGSTRDRFSVKFYLVALLFILFDIETVFLLPYAVSFKSFGMQGFYAVLAFIAVLAVGLLYIVRRRALEWD